MHSPWPLQKLGHADSTQQHASSSTSSDSHRCSFVLPLLLQTAALLVGKLLLSSDFRLRCMLPSCHSEVPSGCLRAMSAATQAANRFMKGCGLTKTSFMKLRLSLAASACCTTQCMILCSAAKPFELCRCCLSVLQQGSKLLNLQLSHQQSCRDLIS
jgi:hypothetical protein